MFVNTTKINKNFSFYADAQIRSTNHWTSVASTILRPGLHFHPHKDWVFTAGYGYITHRRSLSGVSGLIPEHRIWQQAMFTHKTVGSNTITHRLRMEERILMQPSLEEGKLKADGNTYSSRLRYFFRTVIPIHQQFPFKKGIFCGLQNELMFNVGDKSAVNGKDFDQNRLMVSAGYRLHPELDLELGYLNQYVVGRGDNFTNNHVVQLGIYTRF